MVAVQLQQLQVSVKTGHDEVQNMLNGNFASMRSQLFDDMSAMIKQVMHGKDASPGPPRRPGTEDGEPTPKLPRVDAVEGSTGSNPAQVPTGFGGSGPIQAAVDEDGDLGMH